MPFWLLATVDAWVDIRESSRSAVVQFLIQYCKLPIRCGLWGCDPWSLFAFAALGIGGGALANTLSGKDPAITRCQRALRALRYFFGRADLECL